MKKINLLLLLCGLCLYYDCSSAKNQFEKGHYEKAVVLAIKKLRKYPNNKKQQGILKVAYRYAQTVGDQSVLLYKQEQSLQKHDRLIGHYRTLQSIYTDLLRCPGCMLVVTPVDYQYLLSTALQDGAMAYAAEGEALLAEGTRANAREAFKALQKANSFVPNTVAHNLLHSALKQGTENIAISPIPVASQGLQLSSAFFQQQLVQALNTLQYPFANFQPIQAFRGQDIAPDWVVAMSFDDYVVGQTYLKETRETVVRDSVALGNVKDSLGNKQTILGTVAADIRRFEKTVESGGLLNITIRSAKDNKIRYQDKFPGTYIWINDWVTYQGDKRALSKKDRQMAVNKEELPPPPQALFQAFTAPLFQQSLRTLRREFRYLKE